MSTVHNTGGRLLAWIREHRLAVLAGVVVVAFMAVTFAATFRLYDERQARLAAVEALAKENRRLAAENSEQNRQQCEGINGVNRTVRFVLDGSIRNRPADAPPISPAARQLTIDTYRQLPHTDCATGAQTYFDPPFPD